MAKKKIQEARRLTDLTDKSHISFYKAYILDATTYNPETDELELNSAAERLALTPKDAIIYASAKLYEKDPNAQIIADLLNGKTNDIDLVILEIDVNVAKSDPAIYRIGDYIADPMGTDVGKGAVQLLTVSLTDKSTKMSTALYADMDNVSWHMVDNLPGVFGVQFSSKLGSGGPIDVATFITDLRTLSGSVGTESNTEDDTDDEDIDDDVAEDEED